MKAQREDWVRKIVVVDPRRFRFLDESGAKTNMVRLYGRSFDGQRVYDAVPHGHWSTTTMLSVVGLEGANAPMVIEGRSMQMYSRRMWSRCLCRNFEPGI